MASPLRSFSRVDVCVSFVLDSTLKDTWDCARDFRARFWESKFSGVDEFSARKLKGKAGSELGCKRLFMVGTGRLYEKLTSLDDAKHKMGWILVSHPQTKSPFGQASFLNYASKLRFWRVTATDQTFGEWTGEFFTESQYADQMEGWVSNWYYAGFGGLQAASKLAVPVAQKNIVKQPAMMDSRRQLPVNAPSLEQLRFHLPQQDPAFEGQMHQAQMQQQRSHGWVQGADNSDPQQSVSSPPSSPHTASIQEQRHNLARSSSSSNSSRPQQDISRAGSRGLQPGNLQSISRAGSRVLHSAGSALQEDPRSTLQPITEGVQSYSNKPLYRQQSVPPQSRLRTSASHEDRQPLQQGFQGNLQQAHYESQRPMANDRMHDRLAQNDGQRSYSSGPPLGTFFSQQSHSNLLSNSGPPVYANAPMDRWAAQDQCEGVDVRHRLAQEHQPQYRTLGTLKEEGISPKASTRTTSSKVATSGSQDLKGFPSDSRSMASQPRQSSISTASNHSIDRQLLRQQAPAQGQLSMPKPYDEGAPFRHPPRHAEWHSSWLPAPSEPWPQLPRAQSSAEFSAASDYSQLSYSHPAVRNQSAAAHPEHGSRLNGIPRASNASQSRSRSLKQSTNASHAEIFQQQGSTAEEFQHGLKARDRSRGDLRQVGHAQQHIHAPSSSDLTSGMSSDDDEQQAEEEQASREYTDRRRQSRCEGVENNRSSMDLLIANLQERHNLMHKNAESEQVSGSPFAQQASPFAAHR